MKIPYFCCIGAELKRYAKDFDFMNQVYLYKVPADDTMEEVLAQDYFQAVADTVLQDDIVYIYEPTTEMLYTCHFNKQNGHITAEQMSNNIPSLTPDKILISDATGHITAGDVSLDYIKNQLLAKVNIDGSSIMTGPLKFRAGSFSGAIAGGLGDGISIYKLKSDGTIDSEVASLTKTNGFTPGTTNAQNIGSPTLKWKDAHLARVITAVLNNGYDIAVPVTNGPDTLALKSEVDNAANSGRMITDQGVWYAKMYSASTVPTGAEYDGKNYADFSQTDGDGNPVIKIYTGASGAWTLTDTITPPANYDGYVPVTKKIWDIVEQTGQNGGRILWNHQSKEFTPYPNIISFEDIEVTGDSTVDMPLNPSTQQIVNKNYVDSAIAASAATKANVGMDNLTDTGKNIANWSSNVSACIKEISQDIKLELSSGTLTLKSGSKIYVPNGSGTFNTVTITSDKSVTPSGFSTSSGRFAILDPNQNLNMVDVVVDYIYSGTTAPTTFDGNGRAYWYDTTNNVIKRTADSGSTWVSGYSFPIAIVDITNGLGVSKIDQVFNGFGYIGGTAFALPGVKILVPIGKNADGTLRSTVRTTNSVTIRIINSTYTGGFDLVINANNSINGNVPNQYYYNEQTNFYHNLSGDILYFVVIAQTHITAGKIDSFIPRTVFHAVNYSDTDMVIAYQRPTAENGYIWFRKYKSGWVEQGGVKNCTSVADGTGTAGNNTVQFPIEMKNDRYWYSANTQVGGSGWSYANGVILNARSTTGMTLKVVAGTSDGLTVYWEVKGMAA